MIRSGSFSTTSSHETDAQLESSSRPAFSKMLMAPAYSKVSPMAPQHAPTNGESSAKPSNHNTLVTAASEVWFLPVTAFAWSK